PVQLVWADAGRLVAVAARDRGGLRARLQVDGRDLSVCEKRADLHLPERSLAAARVHLPRQADRAEPAVIQQTGYDSLGQLCDQYGELGPEPGAGRAADLAVGAEQCAPASHSGNGAVAVAIDLGSGRQWLVRGRLADHRPEPKDLRLERHPSARLALPVDASQLLLRRGD